MRNGTSLIFIRSNWKCRGLNEWPVRCEGCDSWCSFWHGEHLEWWLIRPWFVTRKQRISYREGLRPMFLA